GETLGLLVRPAAVRGKPTWSDVQFRVEPKVVGAIRVPSAGNGTRMAPTTLRQLRIEVTRCRGGPGGGAAEVDFDEATGVLRGASPYEETHPVPVAPPLADPAAHRRPTIA
ncbi:MAG: hypothetical protein KY475_09200, partial [Planctomycetes bacterium]|nr:hypothetical protein [Planctomycetota bacterium]